VSNRDEIKDLFTQSGLPCSLDDVNYAFPTKGWVKEVFGPAFDQYNFNLGLSKGESEANDCDDFANRAKQYAQMLWFAHRRPPGTALFFAVCKYKIGGDFFKGHAINATVVAGSDGKAEIVFFEPQPKAHIVKLTKEELESCSAILG